MWVILPWRFRSIPIGGTRRNEKLVNTAYFVMVALDKNDHPTTVPGLIVETEEEKLHGQPERRNALRKQRRIENY